MNNLNYTDYTFFSEKKEQETKSNEPIIEGWRERDIGVANFCRPPPQPHNYNDLKNAIKNNEKQQFRKASSNITNRRIIKTLGTTLDRDGNIQQNTISYNSLSGQLNSESDDGRRDESGNIINSPYSNTGAKQRYLNMKNIYSENLMNTINLGIGTVIAIFFVGGNISSIMNN